MPYYQNVFDSEFVGTLLLGDRQLSLNFRVKGNTNSAIEMIAWNLGPYNLTGIPNLTLYYSFDAGHSWTILVVDVTTTAANIASVKPNEIVDALNNDATFSALYEASLATDGKTGSYVKLRSKRARGNWKTYIKNGGAERKLRFNKKAGIAQLPGYFSRHNIVSIDPDSVALLVELDTSLVVDQEIITDAGFDYTVVLKDWELLYGRSGLFQFQKITVDGSDRVTEVIEYPAGAGVGDFAKKTINQYTGANTNPSKTFEIPYTLLVGDLITPP